MQLTMIILIKLHHEKGKVKNLFAKNLPSEHPIHVLVGMPHHKKLGLIFLNRPIWTK